MPSNELLRRLSHLLQDMLAGMDAERHMEETVPPTASPPPT